MGATAAEVRLGIGEREVYDAVALSLSCSSHRCVCV